PEDRTVRRPSDAGVYVALQKQTVGSGRHDGANPRRKNIEVVGLRQDVGSAQAHEPKPDLRLRVTAEDDEGEFRQQFTSVEQDVHARAFAKLEVEQDRLGSPVPRDG